MQQQNMEGAVAGSEEPDETQPGEAKSPGKRLTRGGLSPTVEKMFGALADRFDEPKEAPSSETEPMRTSRPGAARS